MAFFVFLWATGRRFKEYMRDPEFRGLLYTVLVLLGAGTALFRYLEGWSWLDSLYYSVITLTTVGFGDITPDSAWGKLWTIVYVVAGIGVISAFAAQIVAKRREHRRNKVANAQQQMLEAQDALQKLIAEIKTEHDDGSQLALKDLLDAQAKLHDALMKLPTHKKDHS